MGSTILSHTKNNKKKTLLLHSKIQYLPRGKKHCATELQTELAVFFTNHYFDMKGCVT